MVFWYDQKTLNHYQGQLKAIVQSEFNEKVWKNSREIVTKNFSDQIISSEF